MNFAFCSPCAPIKSAGPEFRGITFARLMRKYGIEHNFPILHAPHIERVQRTLQGILTKHLTHTESRRYIHILPLLVQTYNRRWHRMIDMQPFRAERPDNSIWVRLAMSKYYEKAFRSRVKAKFSEGQFVRVAVSKKGFHRSYDETFGPNIYIVHAVQQHMPRPMYKLRLPTGVVMDDLYYNEELQLVDMDTFKVLRVIGRRTRKGVREVQVLWHGWPESMPDWIPEADLGDVEGAAAE